MARIATPRRAVAALTGLVLALPLIPAGAPAEALPPGDPLAALWAVNDGEKIERDQLASPHKRSNSAWDGRTARIFGGRNEMLAFQLIAEAGEKGVGALSVRLPELRQLGGPGVIRYQPPGPDPSDYAGRQIQVFSEHYMNITQRSNADWIYLPNSPAEPPDPLGEKPVQLVPENATKGGFPLAVPPRVNQAFWFDVYVPRNAPAGIYRGQIEVTADGHVRKVPVQLSVFPFALPDENSIDAMFYYEGDQVERRYGKNLDPAFHRFAHRNRVEFVNRYDIPTAEAQKSRFTGSAFTKASGYEGPGEGVGNNLIPRTFYGPGADFDTPEEAKANAPLWTDWLQKNLPGKKTFLYMPDEPSPEQFPYIRSLSAAVKESGAKLPILTTHAYNAELDGPDKAIDIWATVANLYETERAPKLRAEGRDMWFYNGQRPNVGSVLIESPATDPRVNLWAAFKHDVPTYFYWHTDHWRHNSQVIPGRERNQNVWVDPITFYHRRGWWAHGDGVLMYPGKDLIYPDQDRGVDGPISTIQMSNFRRGLQDHLYLTMARRLGLNKLVDATVKEIVPAVFDQAGERVSYPEQGNAFEQARFKLALAIAAKTKPSRNPYDLASPKDWRLLEWETFAKPVRAEDQPWVRDPHGDASPWHVDDLDDDGKYFQTIGGTDFAKQLGSFDVLRKQVPLGNKGWLTAELAARDNDKDGKPEAPPSVSSVRTPGGWSGLKLDEPSHDTGVIVRPTKKLPSRYRVEVTLTGTEFGGKRNGLWEYDGKQNGYSSAGCKSNFPWKRTLDFSGASDQCNPLFNQVRAANGYYFLSIMDYERPAPHNNVFIHTHRKVGMDAYSVSDVGESPAYAVCNPLSGKTYSQATEGNGNGINAIFFAGERYQNPFIGYNAFDMQTECGTFDQATPDNHIIVSAAEIKPELMPGERYRFAIERGDRGYTLEMTGNFRHIGHKRLRYFRPFLSADGKQGIWHYNNTPTEYDGRFNTDLTFGSRTDPTKRYVHKDMWPAGSSYPDYFIIGDPHLNYYEGSATITDLRLFIPR